MTYRHIKPLAPLPKFFNKLGKFIIVSIGILCFSLGIGVMGYHYIGDLSWVDALLNASMILGGMGPVDRMETDAAKLFSSFYALFSGIAFLTTIAVLYAPMVQRFLHRTHLEMVDTTSGEDRPTENDNVK